MDAPFYMTIMGRKFIEGTIPQMVNSINTLNSRISILNGQLQQMEATISRLAAAVDRIEGDAAPDSKEHHSEMEPMSSR
jgi:prefoldin subunit 5